jgi:hypothetical protein
MVRWQGCVIESSRAQLLGMAERLVVSRGIDLPLYTCQLRHNRRE